MNIGMFREDFATVNVGTLNSFPEGSLVTPEALLSRGTIRKLKAGLKILGEGSVEKALTVRAHAFSASANEKILAAGGKVERV